MTSDSGSRPLAASPVSPVLQAPSAVESAKTHEIPSVPECESVSCTMDMSLNVCTVGDRLLKGNNKCVAINELRSERCTAKEAFDSSEVKCLSDKDANICGEQFYCNRDIRITECQYSDSKTGKLTIRKANNECIARKELKVFACKENPQAFNLENFNTNAKCTAVSKL
ncbi:MAG: hypothetical protein EOP10_17095 [Proteobacteria bacterium]|nr:MAG: hypothetical protein EOP10_17095 [Pseudomonadota bacterium]